MLAEFLQIQKNHFNQREYRQQQNFEHMIFIDLRRYPAYSGNIPA